MVAGLENLTVKDIRVAETGQWNQDLISGLFIDEDLRSIQQIPSGMDTFSDRIIQHFNK